LSGCAISVEIYREEKLVGGIYGVQSKKYFSCESMFHLEDNVSKLAFIKLVDYLKNLGFSWMDLQMVTPVSEALGAKYIEKKQFLERIL
jgi:leucyl/phenylalanyl-tRNA---protein transferase